MKDGKNKMKIFIKGFLLVFLFTALAGAQFRYYTPGKQSRGGKFGTKTEEYIIGVRLQYSMPLSPVGENSFSASYKEALTGKLSFGFPAAEALDMFISAGYYGYYNKYFDANILFIPVLAELKYELFKLEDGNTIFISGGAGISFNKLSSSTFNPLWVNLAFSLGAGVTVNLDKGLVLFAGPVIDGFFGRTFNEDIMMVLSVESGVYFRF